MSQPHLHNDWATVTEALKRARGVLLMTHRTPDADGVGSQIALYHALKALDIPVWIHNFDPVPRICRYLPGSEKATAGECFNDIARIDVIVALDCGARSRLGMHEAMFESRTLINIDHHASNRRFGDLNLVDARYCATGAMIHDLLAELGVSLTSPIAKAIYAAVLTDTSAFRLSNVTPEVHRLAADLIAAGADPVEASSAIYASNRLSCLQMLQQTLTTLKLEHGGRSAWLHVLPEMYAETGGDAEDTEGFIDFARSLEGVEVAVFIRPEGEQTWKVSFRSKGDHDVSTVAASLGGGGHYHAAGCLLTGSLEEVRQQVFGEVSQLLN